MVAPLQGKSAVLSLNRTFSLFPPPVSEKRPTVFLKNGHHETIQASVVEELPSAGELKQSTLCLRFILIKCQGCVQQNV